MHQSSLHFGKAFFDTYLSRIDSSKLFVVDIGSQDINGSLRQFAPPGTHYVGVDFASGNGVDVVLTDPYSLPFESGSVDAIVCSSVFEHSEFFWLLFVECLRIVKPDGLVYLNAPSNGMVHRYPIDGWRFYPDAGHALVNWARRQGLPALLLESFIAPKMGPVGGDGMWNDFVAVFLKDEKHVAAHPRRIADCVPAAEFGYARDRTLPWVPGGANPDNRQLVEQLADITRLCGERDERDTQIQAFQEQHDATRAELAALLSSSSWRLTAPLRTLNGALKRMRAPVKHLPSIDGSRPVTTAVATGAAPVRESAAFDVLSGLVPRAASQEMKTDAATLIAFYLPQYHRVAENSEWWGPGFTEWTNVVKGRPNYEGHYQPHLPRELGFYDLSSVEVMREQADMAKLYGVGAFCFYYYWFSGRRILEKPVDNFLRSDIDMPYCLCWANENWTRTWDGDTRSVLLEQKYLETDPKAFIESVLPHFRDRRYLQVDGKPMLVVYRAKEIPDAARVFEFWREAVKAAGFTGLHIAVVDFYDISRPDEVGADALVEFPPHKFNGPQSVPDRTPTLTNREFGGGIVDYAKVMAQSANRPVPDFTLYRGVLPSWDNTARRQNTPTILHGSSPELFEQWLRYVRAYSRKVLSDRPDNFIFINAWNEWGEGCHLEPDQMHGLRYLEAVKASSWFDTGSADPESARRALLAAAAVSVERRKHSPAEQPVDTQTIARALEATRPAESAIQNIAFVLRDYPVIHRIGKRAYKFYLAFRG